MDLHDVNRSLASVFFVFSHSFCCSSDCLLRFVVDCVTLIAFNLFISRLVMPPNADGQVVEKSGVWKYFKRLSPESAECILCPVNVKRKRILKVAKKSTSGMRNHLKAYHPMEYKTLLDQKVSLLIVLRVLLANSLLCSLFYAGNFSFVRRND